MARFAWNEQKNQQLIAGRGISFERIVGIIETNGLLAVIPHPNVDKYPNQKVFIVDVDQYAYLVPFVESQEGVFLKTVIPSRKATRKYLRGSNELPT